MKVKKYNSQCQHIKTERIEKLHSYILMLKRRMRYASVLIRLQKFTFNNRQLILKIRNYIANLIVWIRSQLKMREAHKFQSGRYCKLQISRTLKPFDDLSIANVQ